MKTSARKTAHFFLKKWKTNASKKGDPPGVYVMTNSIEQGLREALLKLKKEMNSDTVHRETLEKAQVWTEMMKLQEEISEGNDRVK